MSSSEWSDDSADTSVVLSARESRDVLSLSHSGTSTPIVGGETLGSAATVTLRIEHPTVSRLHARLELDEDGTTWLVDLDSTNGTFVDGVRVRAAALQRGARIQLGSAELRVETTTTRTRREFWPEDHFGPLLGKSRAMRALFERLAKAATSEATALVQGETGTGKELVARALHEASPRKKRPFVVVDCGAIPESLFESELFGHVRGAFTGADRARDGAVQSAEGGTLFFDEIGELPSSVQPKLLRMLESRTVRRVGESAQQPIDVRVVCATHRDLSRMVATGAFREDLWFRIAVLPLSVPPLRERREDIEMLAQHFAKGRPLEPSLLAEMIKLPWTGNARELRNFVERALTFGGGEALDSALDRGMGAPASDPGALDMSSFSIDRPYRHEREQLLDALERHYLEGLLQRTRWNVSAVADAMEMNRSHVHRLLKKHGLNR